MTELNAEKHETPANSPCALVTGANKGIGYGIVRRLSHVYKGTVYLTARDEVRGREAVYALGRDDRLAEFLQLDVTDRASIERVRDILVAKHGGLDILINNAGISGFDFLKSRGVDHQTPEISPNSPESQVPANEAWSSDVLRQVIDTNFFGILNVCEILFPILRSHARVVNISSGMGTLRSLNLADVKQRLIADDLTVDELKDIMSKYVKLAETKNPADLGYPGTVEGPYAMSKIGVNALTRVQQRLFDQDKSREGIIVNAVTPGFVATEMTAYKGVLTIEEGVDSPVYLALLPIALDGNENDFPKGQFIRDRTPIDWVGEKDKSYHTNGVSPA